MLEKENDITANALQRGLWTHTEKAENYFSSVTGGWKQYNVNKKIKDLFSKSLISTQHSHQKSIELFQKNIDIQKSTIKE